MKSRFTTPLAVSSIFLEWLEYSFFIYFGPTLSRLFFPETDPFVALLLTYGIFAISYIARPLGALIYGVASDRLGRKPPMLFSVFMMSLATIGIGLLPVYASIGILAPILLLVLRLLQSMSVAGEFTSAAVFLMEHQHKNKTLAGSFISMAAALGMCVGGLSVAVASSLAYEHAWRFLFIGAGLLSLTVFFFRRYLLESPSFLKAQAQKALVRNPMRVLWREHRSDLMHVLMVSGFVSVYVYICNIYFAYYLMDMQGVENYQAAFYVGFAQLGVALAIPLCALLAKEAFAFYLKVGLVLSALVAPYLFWVTQSGSLGQVQMALVGYVIANAAVSGVVFRYLYDFFPTNLRCTGLSLPWSLSAALLGGTAPMIAALWVNKGYLLAPGWYVSLVALLTLSLVCYQEHVRASCST